MGDALEELYRSILNEESFEPKSGSTDDKRTLPMPSGSTNAQRVDSKADLNSLLEELLPEPSGQSAPTGSVGFSADGVNAIALGNPITDKDGSSSNMMQVPEVLVMGTQLDNSGNLSYNPITNSPAINIISPISPQSPLNFLSINPSVVNPILSPGSNPAISIQSAQANFQSLSLNSPAIATAASPLLAINGSPYSPAISPYSPMPSPYIVYLHTPQIMGILATNPDVIYSPAPTDFLNNEHYESYDVTDLLGDDKNNDDLMNLIRNGGDVGAEFGVSGLGLEPEVNSQSTLFPVTNSTSSLSSMNEQSPTPDNEGSSTFDSIINDLALPMFEAEKFSSATSIISSESSLTMETESRLQASQCELESGRNRGGKFKADRGPNMRSKRGPMGSNVPAPIRIKLPNGAPKDVLYQCAHEGCGKRFTRPFNCTSHYLSAHTQLRPFECKFCKRPFVRKHDLQRHERLHQDDRPHRCPVCNKAFARSDALKRHRAPSEHGKDTVCTDRSLPFMSSSENDYLNE